jgi:hypothetical protein
MTRALRIVGWHRSKAPWDGELVSTDYPITQEVAMSLHAETFNYLNPTDKQKEQMYRAREAAADYAAALDRVVPEGADKTYLLRKLREVAMWANVAITRHADGAPRDAA